ncbi:hypothetical protein [Streptacidiphilus sp. PB12-B1b]|uniref:hypothetical protein n=1 Tax=Streptacidiphilus sp. PB12-B1b TaxID=2705012 RepID=UPI0015FB34E4|nr:hypothetical protein [Streptacidiphilus sp. PB12-B1b]
MGRELLGLIGELAQIAGWVASNAGEHAEAERIYRLGISAARAAGDGVLSGNVAGSLAYHWSNTGRPATPSTWLPPPWRRPVSVLRRKPARCTWTWPGRTPAPGRTDQQ